VCPSTEDVGIKRYEAYGGTCSTWPSFGNADDVGRHHPGDRQRQPSPKGQLIQGDHHDRLTAHPTRPTPPACTAPHFGADEAELTPHGAEMELRHYRGAPAGLRPTWREANSAAGRRRSRWTATLATTAASYQLSGRVRGGCACAVSVPRDGKRRAVLHPQLQGLGHRQYSYNVPECRSPQLPELIGSSADLTQLQPGRTREGGQLPEGR